MTEKELRKKITETIEQCYESECRYVDCNECEYHRYGENCTDNLYADALIAAGIGDVSEYKHRAEVAEAENAALQKRLENAVELPCKVGDTVYSVFEFPNEKTVLKGTCKHININICSGFPEIFIKLVFETNEQLFLRTYSGNDLNNIFLLRSEAEARLAELRCNI